MLLDDLRQISDLNRNAVKPQNQRLHLYVIHERIEEGFFRSWRTHNWEFLGGGEPRQDLSSLCGPRFKIWSHCLFLLVPLLSPQVLETTFHLSGRVQAAVNSNRIIWVTTNETSHPSVSVCLGERTDPCRAAVWHVGWSLAGWRRREHGQRVRPIQHSAEGVRGCGGRRRRGRRGAAFTGPTSGLCVCHLRQMGRLWYVHTWLYILEVDFCLISCTLAAQALKLNSTNFIFTFVIAPCSLSYFYSYCWLELL